MGGGWSAEASEDKNDGFLVYTTSCGGYNAIMMRRCLRAPQDVLHFIKVKGMSDLKDAKHIDRGSELVYYVTTCSAH